MNNANEKIIDKIVAKLESIPMDFENRVAMAGWFPSAQYEDGPPVAYVAAIQEFGSPKNNIPPRPFIRPAIAEHKSEWVEQMGKGVVENIRGTKSGSDVLQLVGALMASDIQVQIEEGQHLPLSPVTLMLRKWARFGRDGQPITITGKTVGEAAAAVAAGEDYSGVNSDPLRDTGLMIATLSSDVGEAN